MAEPSLTFAGLLRQLRAEALLTQEELAQAAGLSPRSISDLERGINRTARKDSALLLADALGLAGQARTLFVAAARGRSPAAVASHRQALALARSSGDQLAEAVSLNDLGQVQQMTGDHRAAAANHKHALAIFRSIGSRFDEADALCELGFASWLLGDHAAAEPLHRQALDLFRRLGDRLGQAWALEGLGLVQVATGDYPAAAASLQEALRLHTELGSRHGRAVALNCLGDLSRRTSATEDARAYHGEALGIARELRVPLEQARALQGIGHSLLSDHDAGAAGYLRQALAVYERIGSPDGRRVQELLNACDR
jgi:tetratricopeptide (TPR) repeat protein